MSQSELLKKTVSFLNHAGINYMLTGSLVSSMQGEPRSTHDIDIVVELSKTGTEALLKSFQPPAYYIDLDPRETLSEVDMFNLIDVVNGDKIDFWMFTGNEFDRSRFARKQTVMFENVPIQISAPEDTIIAKLNWSKMSGGSKKQLLDALRVFEMQFDLIDQDYLHSWVKKMNLRKEWNELQGMYQSSDF